MKFKRPHFDPLHGLPPGPALQPGEPVVRRFDGASPPSTYVYDDALVLALNVALATRRPLLLAGEPGSGKTTLARNVALVKNWAYYSHTIASRSQASELLWDVDTLARLNDAYNPQRQVWPEEAYVQPGALWWALAPGSAAWRGLPDQHPQRAERGIAPPAGHRAGDGAVLLIDEIDKAEPDVPNDLLEVLDTRGFGVKGQRIDAERQQLLIVITTNIERELPAAFMRRCVAYRMPEPAAGWFARLAMQRPVPPTQALADEVERRLRQARQTAGDNDQRKPGAAEYLDAINALVALDLHSPTAGNSREAWELVERCIFGKHQTIEGQG